MKIAIISTEKLPVPAVAAGAVQIYIDGILPYISKSNDITVYTVNYPGLPQEEEKGGVKYIRVSAGNASEYLANIKRRITNDYDLVYVFNRPRWVLELCNALPDARFGLSLHNEMFSPKKLSASDAGRCIAQVGFINTVSRFIADGVLKNYPQVADKLNVVYSGADTARYRPNWSGEGMANKNRLKEKYGLQDRRIILYVGRLNAKKGTHILLNAMKAVMDTHPDTALVIIGSKWYGSNNTDEFIKSLEAISPTFSGPVVFTGYLSPPEVAEHYNLGDIFVCPSQWEEPLARVHYEAMAAGLPIITTNRGGNAEVVSGNENGLVLNEYDNPDILAGMICHLLDNPSVREDMGRNGRMKAEELYGWERVADDVLKTFNSRFSERITDIYADTMPEQTEQTGQTGQTAQTGQTEQTGQTGQTGQTIKHDKSKRVEKPKITIKAEMPKKLEKLESREKSQPLGEQQIAYPTDYPQKNYAMHSKTYRKYLVRYTGHFRD